MADTREIVLTIKLDSVEKNTKMEEKVERQLNGDSKKQSKSQNRAKVITNAAYQNVKSAISHSWSVGVSRYFNMSENYLGQNDLNTFNSLTSSAISLYSSAHMGYKIGGLVGPAGKVVGAAVGVGFGLLNQAISYQGKLSNYYSSLNAANMQTEWGAKRAGLWDNGRGTEN